MKPKLNLPELSLVKSLALTFFFAGALPSYGGNVVLCNS